MKDKRFDLVLVGDHPPELVAETIFRDFNPDLIPCPCLLLGADTSDSEHYQQIGYIGVAPKRALFSPGGSTKTLAVPRTRN